MAKRKLTKNQKAYAKEIDRILDMINEAKKLGFEVDFTFPEYKGKYITKNYLKKLHDITEEDIYLSSYLKEDVTIEKRGANYKPQDYYETVIDNLRIEFSHYTRKIEFRLNRILDRLLAERSTHDVASAFMNTPSFLEYLPVLKYDSEQAYEEYYTDLISNFPGITDEELEELENVYDEDLGWH